MAVAQKVSALCSDARLAVGTLFLLGFKSLQTVPKRTWRPVKHRTAEVSQASGSLTSLSDQPPSADTRAGPHLPRPPRGCGRLSKRKLQTQARISPPASASHLVLKKINPAMPLVFQKSVEGPAVRPSGHYETGLGNSRSRPPPFSPLPAAESPPCGRVCHGGLGEPHAGAQVQPQHVSTGRCV